MADGVPRTLTGWTVSDLPLGATEASSGAVAKTLNMDDYVYSRFSSGQKSFSVYSAYWAPGRMPTRLVASHTPDRCWTENGLRCVDMRFRETYTLADKPLKPAEYRVFVDGRSDPTALDASARIHVMYWHIVDGKIYDYGARFNVTPSPWLWWKDALAQAAHGAREQRFIRVVSETPFDHLWRDAGFVSVMTKIAALGLWEARGPE